MSLSPGLASLQRDKERGVELPTASVSLWWEEVSCLEKCPQFRGYSIIELFSVTHIMKRTQYFSGVLYCKLRIEVKREYVECYRKEQYK